MTVHTPKLLTPEEFASLLEVAVSSPNPGIPAPHLAKLLALGFAASTPARADYALVKFESGYCRIWWDSAGNPFGVGWIKVAVGLPVTIDAPNSE